MRQTPSQAPILCGVQNFGGKYSVATIELHRPEALNALNTQMLATIKSHLQEWENDPEIACVFVHSENPKAFCAGGDVKSLAAERDLAKAKEFFTTEYSTDLLGHRFKKPMVAWLDGICMGGGLGLTQGASHKIVTEKTVVSMPEVFIGFFADVGASKFLADLPGGIGLYLGMTGRRFSGSSAVQIGLMDHLLPSDSKRLVFADLLRMEWTGNAQSDRQILDQYFSEREQKPTDEISEWAKLKNIFESGDFERIVHALPQEGRKPSLLSQAVFFRLCQKNQGRSWEEVFRQEWNTAIHFCEDTSGSKGIGEFYEGVTALLIEKRAEAQWPTRTIADAWQEAEKFLGEISGSPEL